MYNVNPVVLVVVSCKGTVHKLSNAKTGNFYPPHVTDRVNFL